MVLKVLDSADGDGEDLLEGDGVADISERVSGGVVAIMVGDGPLFLFILTFSSDSGTNS